MERSVKSAGPAGPLERRRPGRPPEGAREALVSAGRELFAERGYGTVTTKALLELAGVSRGAMYHHFDGKLGLFRAVYVEIEDALIGELLAAAEGEQTNLGRLRAGSHAYLRACERSDDLVRVNLRQAREVLGREGWRELAAERGIGVVTATVAAAMEAGEVEPGDPSAIGTILLSALIEAALQVGEALDPVATRRVVGPVVDRFIDALATPEPARE